MTSPSTPEYFYLVQSLTAHTPRRILPGSLAGLRRAILEHAISTGEYNVLFDEVLAWRGPEPSTAHYMFGSVFVERIALDEWIEGYRGVYAFHTMDRGE